ncbi:MAG TPA: XRE family transcriptional regulator [Bacteroidaceae bacterium]|nr:XRE family transcriptional regulator [Bacteroidaceae bacterium]
MDTKASVGRKIRSLRESKNIEIDILAERSQLTIDQLNSIEEGEPLPGLAPLIKIARALGVRLGTFLDDSQSIGPVVCKKAKCGDSVRFSNYSLSKSSNMIYHPLSEGKENRHMESFIIDILPDTDQSYIFSSHEGEEFIYVLEGKIEVNYGKKVYVLTEGDSIHYDSIVNHHVHGFNHQKARILAVVYAPI